MTRFLKSILASCFAVAMSALALQACSSDTNSGTCVPNSTQSCVCRTGGPGVQTCQASGAFDTCACIDGTGGAGGTGGGASSSSGTAGAGGSTDCHKGTGVSPTCGNGMVDDPAEECDDGNCIATDSCNNNCKKPYCGDGVITPEIGETCEGEVDCSNCGIMATTSSSSSSSSGACMGQEVFAGLLPAQNGAFSGAGLFGIDAANALCQGMGATQMCDYVQWEQLNNNPAMYPTSISLLTAAIPNGKCTKIWLQRTTAVGANMPGPGGRCNNWNYGTDHDADGEFVDVCNTAGVLTYTYTLDPDTVYQAGMNGPHQNPGIPCNAMRPIPCCYKLCIP